MDQLSGSAS